MAKKKKKTFRFSRIKVFVLIGVLVYASLTFFNQQTLLAAQQPKQEELLAEQEALNQEIDYYKNEREYIGSDDYVEREARERLGWLKPGEKKYVFPENDDPAADSSSERGRFFDRRMLCSMKAIFTVRRVKRTA